MWSEGDRVWERTEEPAKDEDKHRMEKNTHEGKKKKSFLTYGMFSFSSFSAK